jgi:hypothetical protein
MLLHSNPPSPAIKLTHKYFTAVKMRVVTKRLHARLKALIVEPFKARHVTLVKWTRVKMYD